MRCWKTAQDYLLALPSLRNELEMADDVVKELEECVYFLYGGKGLKVRASRNEIF